MLRRHFPLSNRTTKYWFPSGSAYSKSKEEEAKLFLLNDEYVPFLFEWIRMNSKRKLTGQPSEIFLRLLSVTLTHDSRFIDVSFAQCLLIAWMDWSVIFLQSDKSSRSTLWQCWASVLWKRNGSVSLSRVVDGIEFSKTYRNDWSPTDWQPRNDKYFKKPPHLCEIFSMTGPCGMNNLN